MNGDILELFSEYLEKQDILSKLTEHERLHSYSYSEVHTIAAVGDLELPNVTAIAEHMRMTKGTVSKILKRLQLAGLIVSYQTEDNKQKVFYKLNAAGKFLYDEHEKRHRLWLKRDEKFLERYSSDQIEMIENFMRDFNSYLEEQITELGGQRHVD